MAGVCYCHKPLSDDGHVLTLTLDLDWGAADLREPAGKTYEFCSFACIADWARDRAVANDDHVLVEGEPAEAASGRNRKRGGS